VEKAKSEIKDLTTRLKTSNKELKSLETSLKSAEGVEEKRIKSDLSQLRPKIKQMESNLSQAKEASTSKFQFKAPVVPTSSKKGESKGHKFLGDTRNTSLGINTPAEDLPDAGTLYSEDENRYLAITNWEEVVQGRKDAKRLNATLCAVREVLG
jgi:DNA gyrase/topoisomerase IV subunit A